MSSVNDQEKPSPASPPQAIPPARVDGTPTIQDRRSGHARTRSLTVNTNILRPSLPIVAVQHPPIPGPSNSMMAPRPAPQPPQHVTPQQTLAVPQANVEPLSPVTPPPGDAGAPSVLWVLHHTRKGNIQAAIKEQHPEPQQRSRQRSRTRTRTQTNPSSQAVQAAPVPAQGLLPPVTLKPTPTPTPVVKPDPAASHLQAVAAAAARAHANANAHVSPPKPAPPPPPRSADVDKKPDAAALSSALAGPSAPSASASSSTAPVAPPPRPAPASSAYTPAYPEPTAWHQPELWVAPAHFANRPPTAESVRLATMREAMRALPPDKLRAAFEAHEGARRRNEQLRVTQAQFAKLRLPITLPPSMQKPNRGPGPLPRPVITPAPAPTPASPRQIAQPAPAPPRPVASPALPRPTNHQAVPAPPPPSQSMPPPPQPVARTPKAQATPRRTPATAQRNVSPVALRPSASPAPEPRSPHPPAPDGPLGDADIQRAFAIAKRYLEDAQAGRSPAVDRSIPTFLYAPPSSPDVGGNVVKLSAAGRVTLPSIRQMLEPRVAAPPNMPPGTLVAPSTQLAVRPSPLDQPNRSFGAGGSSIAPSIAPTTPSPARARKQPPAGRVREREFERSDAPMSVDTPPPSRPPSVTPPRVAPPMLPVYGGPAVPGKWVTGLPPPQPSPEVQRIVQQLGPVAVPGPFVLTGNEIWILDRSVIAELMHSVGMQFEPGPAFNSGEVVRINLDFLYQCRLNQHIAQMQHLRQPYPPVERAPSRGPRLSAPPPETGYDATHPSAPIKRKAEHVVSDTGSGAPPVRRRVSYPIDPPTPTLSTARPRSSSACRPAPPIVYVHPPGPTSSVSGQMAPPPLVLGPAIEFRRQPSPVSRTPSPASAMRHEPATGPSTVAIDADRHRTPGLDSARSTASTPASVSPVTPAQHLTTLPAGPPQRKASLSDQMDVDAMPAVA